MTVTITLTLAGTNVGPFDLYSDADGYTTAFETGVSRAALLAGYTSTLVPVDSTTVLAISTGTCSRELYMPIDGAPTTTTTTTSSSSTTTTTTTTAYVPVDYDYYLATEYTCVDCTISQTDVLVAFPAGFSYIGSHYYSDISHSGFVYKISTSTGSGVALILDTLGSSATCSLACSV
jgi:hypothetical protein